MIHDDEVSTPTRRSPEDIIREREQRERDAKALQEQEERERRERERQAKIAAEQEKRERLLATIAQEIPEALKRLEQSEPPYPEGLLRTVGDIKRLRLLPGRRIVNMRQVAVFRFRRSYGPHSYGGEYGATFLSSEASIVQGRTERSSAILTAVDPAEEFDNLELAMIVGELQRLGR